MNIEETKKYLNRGYYLDKRINCLQEELSVLESRLYKCTPSYGSTGSNSSPQSTFEFNLDKLLKYRDRLNYEIDKLIDTKTTIKQSIDLLDDEKARLIMRQRYILFHTFDKIANQMGITERQVYKIHKKSLENLSKFIEVQYPHIV